MLDPTTTAIITGAAGNVVAYMVTGRIDELRGWVARVFRRGSEDQRRISLAALEEDRVALAQGQASESEVKSRWIATLAACFVSDPEVRAEIAAMASAGESIRKSVRIGSQHNHGSGTFIGGDNFGRIGRPE
ncbi:hypothetical protein ACNAW0_28650 [Micromonospora sp. SL1-18]|uniref:hypothetical protein n=1 Tax=Micromonospora sp. SL1-18 TaxID=3399128 RepID=UPI003A4DF5B0